MQFDLTNLSAGEIAVLGGLFTLISTFAAATATVVSTYVKARLERRGAAEAAHREFLLREFQPFCRTRASALVNLSH